MLVKTEGQVVEAHLDRGPRFNGCFHPNNTKLNLKVEVFAGDKQAIYDALSSRVRLGRTLDVYIDVPEDPGLPDLLEKMRLRAAKAEEELAKLKASIQALTK